MIPPTDDRISTAEAAAILGINRQALTALAMRKGWETSRCPDDGRFVTLDRAVIDAELKARQIKASRPPPPPKVSKEKTAIPSARPKDLVIAERCARIIREYWVKRGYTVQVETVGVEIVSDMVNGLPVR